MNKLLLKKSNSTIKSMYSLPAALLVLHPVVPEDKQGALTRDQWGLSSTLPLFVFSETSLCADFQNVIFFTLTEYKATHINPQKCKFVGDTKFSTK